MFSKVFGFGLGASSETQIQQVARAKLAGCKTYKDASIQRGRYGGALTRIFKQARELRDNDKKGHVLDPNVIIWALKRLEKQKQATFFFAKLIVQHFEANDWPERFPADYDVSKAFTDRYYLRWLESRYFLYALLNKVQPSAETTAAQLAARPSLEDQSTLYLPDVLVSDDDKDGESTSTDDSDGNDDEDGEGGETEPLEEGEVEDEGDQEGDFLAAVSSQARKQSISDIDDDAVTFRPGQLDETDIFDNMTHVEGDDDRRAAGQGMTATVDAAAPNLQPTLASPAAASPAAAAGTIQHQAPPPPPPPPPPPAGSLGAIPKITIAAANAPIRHQGLHFHTYQGQAPILASTFTTASSAGQPQHSFTPPLNAVRHLNPQIGQHTTFGPTSTPVQLQTQTILPATQSILQTGQQTPFGQTAAASLPPTTLQHVAQTGQQTVFTPVSHQTQTGGQLVGMPSNLPANNFPFQGMTSSNTLNAPAAISTSPSTNTMQTLTFPQARASVRTGNNSAVDPVAQILQSMQIGSWDNTNSGAGSFLAPGGPVRAAQGQFRGHQVGSAPPGPAFVQNPPVGNLLGGDLNTGGQNNGGDSNFMMMYSNSLASTFNVSNIIKTPFSGNPSEFPTFIMLWSKVHRILQNLQFDDREKFMIFKQVLTGPSLNYVKDLPVDSEESYSYSLKTLYGYFYDQKVNLLTVINNLMTTPKSDGSVSSRQKVHSALISYTNSIACLQATNSDVRFAYELSFCTSRLLDQSWNREWMKFCSKRKNFANPIGADVNFADLCDNLFQTMREQSQIRQLGYASGEKDRSGDSRGRFNRASAAAAQGQKEATANGGASGRRKKEGSDAAPYARATEPAGMAAAAMQDRGARGQRPPRPQQKAARSQSSEIKEVCIFCRRPNGPQEHSHPYPLNCPKVKNKIVDHQKMRDIGKTARACRLCFAISHTTNACDAPASWVCRAKNQKGERCGLRHNTIWHIEKGNNTYGRAAAANRWPPCTQ